jgi:hypothetical protein
LSQFWYDDQTAIRLAEEAIRITQYGGSIACLSCPSVFLQLYKLLSDGNNTKSLRICVFEYDRRFEVFGQDYVYFDFNRSPDSLEGVGNIDADADTDSRSLKAAFDTIIADPPFLSDECWLKTADHIRWLSRLHSSSTPSTLQSSSSCPADSAIATETTSESRVSTVPVGCKVIVCTGAVMGALINKCLGCASVEGFKPRHKGDRLSNEFGCFTNYPFEGSI